MAKVAIFILNWNGIKYTRECIESILSSKFRDYDIYILDNGSKNNEADSLTKEFANHISVYRSEKNLGFAGGNNFLKNKISSKNYQYYLLLNQDAILDRFCLSNLIKYMDNNDHVAVCGPKVLQDDQITIQSMGANINFKTGKIISRYHLKLDQDIGSSPTEVDCIVGNCFCARATIVNDIGLFDEKYFAYYEEADWCVRAKQAGYQCMVIPEAKIYHSKPGGFRTYLNVRNMIWFEKKFASKSQLIIFFLYFWIFVLERIKKGSPLKELWSATIDGWFNNNEGTTI